MEKENIIYTDYDANTVLNLDLYCEDGNLYVYFTEEEISKDLTSGILNLIIFNENVVSIPSDFSLVYFEDNFMINEEDFPELF